jgi:hypothetical protein
MSKTRTQCDKKRLYEKNKKASQRQTKEARERHRKSEAARRQARKIRDENVENDVRNLRLQLERKDRKIAILKEEVTVLKGLLSTLTLPDPVARAENLESDDEIEVASPQEQVQWETLPFFKHLLDRPYLFKSMIRMTLDEYRALERELIPIISSRNVRGSPKKFNRIPKYPAALRLVTTLLYLSIYPTQKLFSAMLGITEWTLLEWVKHVLSATREWAETKIVWPSDEDMEHELNKWQHLLYDFAPKAVCAIDGTEIEISRPHKPHSAPGAKHETTYSVKKKQHSLSVQIVCLHDGRIIYASAAEEVHNDQSQFISQDLRAKFEGKNYGFLADSGYFPNAEAAVKKHGLVFAKTPNTKRPRKGEKGAHVLSGPEKLENTMTSRRRVIVENVNAHMKKWAAMGTKFRHYSLSEMKTVDINLVVRFIAALVNIRIQSGRPLRRPEWLPHQDASDRRRLSAARVEEAGNEELTE